MFNNKKIEKVEFATSLVAIFGALKVIQIWFEENIIGLEFSRRKELSSAKIKTQGSLKVAKANYHHHH